MRPDAGGERAGLARRMPFASLSAAPATQRGQRRARMPCQSLPDEAPVQYFAHIQASRTRCDD
eukprot:6246807-Pyramimonas_sp.AAC.1